LILGPSKKICRKTLNLIKIGHKYWAFYLQTQVRIIIIIIIIIIIVIIISGDCIQA